MSVEIVILVSHVTFVHTIVLHTYVCTVNSVIGVKNDWPGLYVPDHLDYDNPNLTSDAAPSDSASPRV